LLDSLALNRDVIVAVVAGVVTLVTTAHVILYKRDPRAAVAWVGFVWMLPLLGPVLYVLFGINRIRRRGVRRRARTIRVSEPDEVRERPSGLKPGSLPPEAAHLDALAELVNVVTRRTLEYGNLVTPLVDGDEAYPAMLEAIRGADRSVALSSYIFRNDEVGREFVDALTRASGRGVEVRVIVDAVGARYSFPTVVWRLRRLGVPAARFMRTVLPFRLRYMNLRNHRKLMVVDGEVGFTGGMNIHDANVLARKPGRPQHDLHFRIEGPVVRHLTATFVEDWAFCAGETLDGEAWFPRLEPKGDVAARGITEGPDEDFEKLRWSVLGALACARRSVRIVTPYFVPDPGLISALSVAAMRGVRVEILLPQVSDLRIVQWASTALLWQVLEGGCRVYLSPPPFDHTKLMLVDGAWTLLGSGNLDPRSLRLNFEFNVECYGQRLAAALDELVERRIRAARPVSLKDVDGRSLPVRLRDGAARLLAPYL
jgi:cardiolipin synthase